MDGAAQDVGSGGSRLLGQDVLEVLEVAASLGHGRHGTGKRRTLHTALPFVIAEEKDLVLDDRAAKRSTELIETIFALYRSRGVVLEPIGSVKFVVAEKLPYVPMERIGAGFDGGVQNRASGPAQLRAVISGLHFEFLNGVNRGQDDVVGAVEEVHVVRVVVDAVKKVVVLRGPLAICGEGARPRVAPRVRLRGLHARAKLRQKGEIAAIEGQSIHFLLVDHLPHRGFLSLQQWEAPRSLLRFLWPRLPSS